MARAGRIAAFMFHEVTDDSTSSGFQHPGARPYRHSLAQFARCLDAIAAANTLPTLITETRLADRQDHVFLTFDDGGKSALIAGEMLTHRGWRGHFFIVSSLIGKPGFLDARDIRSLREGGHLVGSHSHTHPYIFRSLPRSRMLEEWRRSCDILAQLLGEPILSASVPGGDINTRTLESADASGVQYLFTSEPWLLPRRLGHSWILGRFSVKAGTPPTLLRQLASFRGWKAAQLRRRVKVWTTLALPWLYRLYIKAQTNLPRR